MATHDYIISNASGASVRADLNNALAAIVSNNSNATSPATTYAYQWWADTTTGQLKLRNSANSAWITIFELDGTMLMEDGSASAPGLAFASDLNTGFFRSAADKINFATGGAERLEIGDSEVVFNDPSNDVDFRVESNGNTHMLFVDAGNDRVSIGAASPSNGKLEISNSTNGDEGIRLSDTRATPSANKRTVDIRYTGTNGRTASNTQLLYLTDNNASSTQPFMEVENASSSLFVIDSSGQVGIAKSSPSARFHVGGTAGDFKIAADGATIDFTRDGANYIQAAGSSATLNYRSSQHIFTGSSLSDERARIDSSGRLLVGTSTSRIVEDHSGNGPTGRIQIEATNSDAIASIISAGTSDANRCGTLSLGRHRNSTVGGTPTVVQDGDSLGAICFAGGDGTDMRTKGAKIVAQVDGTPGSNDMPGRLVFSTTADGGVNPTERLRIDSSGFVGIGTDAPGAKLSVVEDSTNNTPLSHNYPATQSGLFVSNNQTGTTGAFSAVTLRAYNSSSTAQAASIIAQSTGSGFSPSLLFTQRSGSGTNAERMRIDADGRLLIGTTSATNSANVDIQTAIVPATDTYAKLQLRTGSYGYILNGGIKQGEGGRLQFDLNNAGSVSTKMVLNTAGELLVGTSDDFGGNNEMLQIARSGGGAIALLRNDTSVSAGNELGAISWYGNDSTSTTYQECATIRAIADGTHGDNDKPTRLGFSVTKDNASSPTERMRINQNGVFNSFTDDHFTVRTIRTGSGPGILGVRNGATSITDGTQVFVVRADGDCENTNNNYGAISDIKLKENIIDASSQWDDLKAIQVRKYNFKEETRYGTHTQLGVVAQEVELVSPGLVSETPDFETVEVPVLDENGEAVLDENGEALVTTEERDLGTTTKSVNYSVLYMKAVKALQEAMDRIETLEAKVAALEAG